MVYRGVVSREEDGRRVDIGLGSRGEWSAMVNWGVDVPQQAEDEEEEEKEEERVQEERPAGRIFGSGLGWS
jgi:hypothetical protein